MSTEDDLFEAVSKGDIDQFENLLQVISSVNIKNKYGDALLHVAVSNNNYTMVKMLVQLGAEINVTGLLGRTPLHLAILQHDFYMASALIESPASLYIADKEGNLPIHLAAEQGNFCIVSVLLDKGSVNVKNNAGLIPIHLAIQNGHKAIVEVLCCISNINTQDKEGNTALIMAVKRGNISIVNFLLESGADYNKTNNAGQTFGEFASSEEMISIVSKYDRLSDADCVLSKSDKRIHSSTSSSGSSIDNAHTSKYRKVRKFRLSHISFPKRLQSKVFLDTNLFKRSSSGSSASRSSTPQYDTNPSSESGYSGFISSPRSSLSRSSITSKCEKFLDNLCLSEPSASRKIKIAKRQLTTIQS